MKVTGAYVAERILETLPEKKNFKDFFDNGFPSVSLSIALKKNGHLVAATLTNDLRNEIAS